ncbi:hypothetical protein QZH41_009053 [Actinostola sp. cb2023]|nr:hypothetical protein QZH41_009053 [Actinostola sp. cb2023]
MADVKYKLARCVKIGPPQRLPEELRNLEKGFVLDNIAVSTLSDDSGRANPKMSTAIPPYNAQLDRHTRNYFEKKLVQRLLSRTQQPHPGDSITGKQMDKFYETGMMGSYLKYRNGAGAGYSRGQVSGHSLFLNGLPPINGWHGPFGFRRNTPWLRNNPSVFTGKIAKFGNTVLCWLRTCCEQIPH